MRNKDRINDMKREAIVQAERLGHKLKGLHKYRDSEVYYSSFCARCSAYLRVTTFGSEGGAVEQPCQRLCDCKQPLTPDDLDGKCIGCRGNRLTLYPKTPAVRAKDTHFIEYCRKEDRNYEPSPETMSDYFWCCQQCFKRLGPGYQGDPDERGLCGACIKSEQAYAKRKAEAIEAAGGLKAWQRNRLVNKLLTPIDYVAMFISFLFLAVIAFRAVVGAAVHVSRELRSMWSHADDRMILIILTISAAWCALRWKTLNAKPSDF